ncbi:hypothetical protein B0H34DRAFT_673380 [Crassisporium funariophilum]|nr:hypothetical protein B0H34DRAFT_673380 [Crassisporium funariophilum]
MVPSASATATNTVLAATVTTNSMGAVAASTASAPALSLTTGAELKEPQFAEGYQAGGKAKAGDYEPVRMCQNVLAVGRLENTVALLYGFNLNTTPRVIDHNWLLTAKLLSGSAFHHKDPDAKTGYGQSGLISDLIQLGWFDSAKELAGIVYSSLFNPISLKTLTLLFTLFCLKEWSSGKRTPARFFEKTINAAHEAHCLDLKNWNDLNVQVTQNIHIKLYTRAKRNSGVTDANAPVAQLTGEAED